MTENKLSNLLFLSDCTPVFTVLGSPGKINPFRGTSLKGSIKLDWSPPKNSDEIPIDNYIIRYGKTNDPPDMINGNVSTSMTTITITGLLNGVSYRFWISGINRFGEGVLSAPQSWTPGAPPEPITLVRRGHHTTKTVQEDINGLQHVGVEFASPLNYNGSPPTEYIIRYYNINGNASDIRESFIVHTEINQNNIDGNNLMVDKLGNSIFNTNGFMGNYIRRECIIPRDISSGTYRFVVYSKNLFGVSAVSLQYFDISLGLTIPRFVSPQWTNMNTQIGNIYRIIPGDNKITFQFRQVDISGIGIDGKFQIQYTTNPNYWYYPISSP